MALDKDLAERVRLAPEHDKNLAKCFLLALNLVRGLGYSCDRVRIMERLREVATGEASLFNSPAEEVATTEKEWDVEYSPQDREELLTFLTQTRPTAEAIHRFMATRIYELLMLRRAA